MVNMRKSNVPSSADWEILKVTNKLTILNNRRTQVAFDIKNARSWGRRIYLKIKYHYLTSYASQLNRLKKYWLMVQRRGE